MHNAWSDLFKFSSFDFKKTFPVCSKRRISYASPLTIDCSFENEFFAVSKFTVALVKLGSSFFQESSS